MTILEALGTIAGTFAVCLGAALLPLGGGIEVYLVATSSLLPPTFVAPLVLASAAGSVAAKTILFFGATRVGARSQGKTPRFMRGERTQRLLHHVREGPWVRRGILFLATTVGLPPFYATTLAVGAMRTPVTEFVLVSFVGQTIRFAAVWAVPQIAARMAAG